MGEETSDADANAMNLDLNLGTDTEPLSGTVANEDIILDDWQRLRQRFLLASDHGDLHDRWPHPRDTISLELDELLENSGNGSVLQAGEGSVAAEERADEVPKACEISNGGVALDETSEKKEEVEKGGGDDVGFFDCNICFDMAKDPVVTCCGHLFCWPCLYKWLHLQSRTKGCPVCKGEVNVKSVIPIYGRGNDVRVHEEEDTNLKIPLRPTARRLESRLDLNREIVLSHEHANASQAADIISVSNRHFGGRAFRRVQNLVLQRTQGNRVTFPSTLNSADRLARLIDGYSPGNPIDVNQELPLSVEDRDSFSSIAAVINSESQEDTAAEIDSIVSLSTSSSSRSRNDASRVSDRNSGDSRAPKRRRLN